MSHVADDNADSTTEPDTGSILPLSYRTLAILAYLGLLIWLGYLLIETRTWRWEDRLFPRMVGTFALLLGIVLLGREILPATTLERLQTHYVRATSSGRSTELAEKFRVAQQVGVNRSQRDQEIVAMAMIIVCISLPAFIYLFGFLLVIPVFLFAFDYAIARRLRRAALIAISMSMVLYVLFVVLLGAHLWEGIIEFPSVTLMTEVILGNQLVE